MRLSLIVFTSFALCAQTPSAAKKTTPSSANVSTESVLVEAIRRIAALEKLVENNDKTIWSILGPDSQTVDRLQHKSIEIDPSNPGPYQRLDTSVGPVLVSMGKVEPYLDGQKVNLLIGNPLAIRYEGFKISADYGPRVSSDTKWGDWLKVIKKKEFSLTQALISGQWNTVELIFPDAKAEAFGYLSLSITVNSVSFK